jgi:hypothetical protein
MSPSHQATCFNAMVTSYGRPHGGLLFRSHRTTTFFCFGAYTPYLFLNLDHVDFRGCGGYYAIGGIVYGLASTRNFARGFDWIIEEGRLIGREGSSLTIWGWPNQHCGHRGSFDLLV